MKTKTYFGLLWLCLATWMTFVTCLAVAQTNGNTSPSGSDGGGLGNVTMWINLLTPVVTPLLVAGVKQLKSDIPSMWIPLIATAVGTGGNLLASYALAHNTTNFWFALALGLGGIGVREVIDQIKPEPVAAKLQRLRTAVARLEGRAGG